MKNHWFSEWDGSAKMISVKRKSPNRKGLRSKSCTKRGAFSSAFLQKIGRNCAFCSNRRFCPHFQRYSFWNVSFVLGQTKHEVLVMDKTNYSVLVLFFLLYIFLLLCGQSPFINTARFLVVCLCLIPACRYGVPMAALFTIISDGILLFSPYYYKLGVFFFCHVQLFYISFFLDKSPCWALFFPSLLLLFFPLPILGAVYALLFLLHLYLAYSLWKQRKAKPYFGLYLFGLFLYICCDITVALGYFTTTKPILIWSFYAPSQLLLAFTAKGLLPLPKPFAPYP